MWYFFSLFFLPPNASTLCIVFQWKKLCIVFFDWKNLYIAFIISNQKTIHEKFQLIFEYSGETFFIYRRTPGCKSIRHEFALHFSSLRSFELPRGTIVFTPQKKMAVGSFWTWYPHVGSENGSLLVRPPCTKWNVVPMWFLPRPE